MLTIYGRLIVVFASVVFFTLFTTVDAEARVDCLGCVGNGQVCVYTGAYQCPEGCVIQECWWAGNDCSNCQTCYTCYYYLGLLLVPVVWVLR
jgi:hypothetical protein